MGSEGTHLYKQRYYAAHHEAILEANRQRNYAHGQRPMSENRSCTSFLGVHVAERMLSHLFKDVVRMPYGTPGYDFTCVNGYNIDVKAACRCVHEKQATSWTFHVKPNTVANYFLCIAFDNRENLNPLHVWLIPGNRLSHKVSASISESTLDKWAEYEQAVSEAINCCNTLKGDGNG